MVSWWLRGRRLAQYSNKTEIRTALLSNQDTPCEAWEVQLDVLPLHFPYDPYLPRATSLCVPSSWIQILGATLKLILAICQHMLRACGFYQSWCRCQRRRTFVWKIGWEMWSQWTLPYLRSSIHLWQSSLLLLQQVRSQIRPPLHLDQLVCWSKKLHMVLHLCDLSLVLLPYHDNFWLSLLLAWN